MNIYQYDNINLAKIFKALSDETRLRITRVLLNGTFHVNEILFILNSKQSNISHHLRIMQDCSIVINKKEGSLIYYSINYNLGSNNIINILNAIQNEAKQIIYYQEDYKRLETILQKRKRYAEDYFNKIGSNLDNVQARLFQSIYNIKETIGLFDSKLDSLLDIGCGTGKNLPVLAQVTEKVIGLDSSPTLLQLAEHVCISNHLNYELKLGDVQNLPFTDGSINGAFMNMVLHHIFDPVKAFNEISRILYDNGMLLLIDLLNHQNESFREEFADLWLGFDQNEIKGWLEKNNFQIKKEIIKESKKGLINQSPYKVIIILAEKITYAK